MTFLPTWLKVFQRQKHYGHYGLSKVLFADSIIGYFQTFMSNSGANLFSYTLLAESCLSLGSVGAQVTPSIQTIHSWQANASYRYS